MQGPYGWEVGRLTLTSFVYSVWLTPITNIGASAEGAEMMTFLAPPFRCALAFSITVKMPVDSQMMSAPCSPHGTCKGGRAADQASNPRARTRTRARGARVGEACSHAPPRGCGTR